MSLIEPALVDRMAAWLVRATHAVVKIQLGHEARVRLGRRLRLADDVEGLVRREGMAEEVVADEVGDQERSGAGAAIGAGGESERCVEERQEDNG